MRGSWAGELWDGDGSLDEAEAKDFDYLQVDDMGMCDQQVDYFKQIRFRLAGTAAGPVPQRSGVGNGNHTSYLTATGSRTARQRKATRCILAGGGHHPPIPQRHTALARVPFGP